MNYALPAISSLERRPSMACAPAAISKPIIYSLRNVTTITTAENIIKKIDLGNLKSKK